MNPVLIDIMNTLDAYVTKVISRKPILEYGKYWVKVEYICYGLSDEMTIPFDTEKEALEVKIDDKFLV